MIILDTCAIIWDALDNSKLTMKAQSAIQKANNDRSLYICDISIWELAMLIKRGRLNIEETASNFIQLFLKSRNVEIISISPEIAELSVSLDSSINNDPADRLIAATSIIKQLPIVTADNNLLKSRLIETIW